MICNLRIPHSTQEFIGGSAALHIMRYIKLSENITLRLQMKDIYIFVSITLAACNKNQAKVLKERLMNSQNTDFP